MSAKPDGVLVSPHSIRRFEQRFPDETREARAVIFGEVSNALRDNRTAKREPSWVALVDRRRDEGIWYAWNPAATRCYVLHRATQKMLEGHSRQGEFRRSWVVRTVLARRDDEAELRVQARKSLSRLARGQASSGPYSPRRRRMH